MSSLESKRSGRPTDEAKRQAILAAAAQSFFEHGYAATSIEQVAADAGVSKVTIYNRFGDKRGLFAEAVALECQTMRGSLEVPAALTGDLRARLTAIGAAMGAFLSRPQMIQFERRVAAETEHEPAIGAAFLAAGPHRMKQAFASYLQALDTAGELRIADPSLATEQFVSMCKGMGDLERRFGHKVEPARDLERLHGAVDVFLKAYRVDHRDHNSR